MLECLFVFIWLTFLEFEIQANSCLPVGQKILTSHRRRAEFPSKSNLRFGYLFRHYSEAVARRCSAKKMFFCEKFTRKHLCRSVFLNKVAELTLKTLLKNWLRHKRFPVNFVKFLWAPFLFKTSVWGAASDNLSL